MDYYERKLRAIKMIEKMILAKSDKDHIIDQVERTYGFSQRFVNGYIERVSRNRNINIKEWGMKNEIWS